jgi:hypothetical protein
MLEAAKNQGVEPDRISFIDALRWLTTARPGDPLPELIVLPKRTDRIYGRVIKRRPKNYPWMSKTRAEFSNHVLAQQLVDEAA